jgi:hypothetical protein
VRQIIAPPPLSSDLPSQNRLRRRTDEEYETILPRMPIIAYPPIPSDSPSQIIHRKKRTVVESGDQGYGANPVQRPIIAPPPSSSDSPSQDRLRKRKDRPDYSIPSSPRKKRKEDDSIVVQPLTGYSIDDPIDVDELFVSPKILRMRACLSLTRSQKRKTFITLDMEIVPSVRSSITSNFSPCISWLIFLCRSTRARK